MRRRRPATGRAAARRRARRLDRRDRRLLAQPRRRASIRSSQALDRARRRSSSQRSAAHIPCPDRGARRSTPFRCAPTTSEPAPACCSRARPARELDPESLWLARMLGQAGVAAPQPAALAETRFGQERMLLYSIINAVTDPILLTDTEGKLIIANTHAEKLFAAPEEASEGWRRAVALNNMLFSAALSTSAVAHDRARAARAAARRSARRLRPAVRAAELAREGRAAGHLRRLGPAQRHRPRAREGGDRGELPNAARRAGGSPRRAPPARSDHRLGRRSRSWSPIRKGTSS